MFEKYIEIFTKSFTNYFNYLINEVSAIAWHNYFWWLVFVSLFFYSLEVIIPWRKDQSKIRRDFWLDAFYMFFNMFLFSVVGFYAISQVVSTSFQDVLRNFNIELFPSISVAKWPRWAQFLLMFLLRDFIHWNVHRLLHRVSWLWEFHKVHHSVKEMGFAAHLRFHWMENVVYRTLEYIPLGLLGFSVTDFFILHAFLLAVGHFNHSNISIPLGPLKYLLNNPQMHIWHHAKELPPQHPYGMNFGITLSLWDYLFKTAYIPSGGRDIELGFGKDEHFPQTFIKQNVYPMIK